MRKALEPLTELQKDVEANEAGGELEKCQVNRHVTFISYPKSVESMQPPDSPLDDPTEPAKAAAMLGTAFREKGLNAKPTQKLACRLTVVSTISIITVRTRAWMSGAAAHGWNVDDQREKMLDVRSVCGGHFDLKRNALPVGDDVMLAAGFPPIGRVWSSVFTSSYSPHRAAVGCGVAPINAGRRVDLGQKNLVQPLEDSCFLPIAQATPASHTAPAAHLLRQHLPGNARLQDKDDSCKGGSIVNRRSPTLFIVRRRFGISGSMMLHNSSETKGFAMMHPSFLYASFFNGVKGILAMQKGPSLEPCILCDGTHC